MHMFLLNAGQPAFNFNSISIYFSSRKAHDTNSYTVKIKIYIKIGPEA